MLKNSDEFKIEKFKLQDVSGLSFVIYIFLITGLLIFSVILMNLQKSEYLW